MEGAKRNPFNPGDGNKSALIMEGVNNPIWPGWDKWQIVYYFDSGRRIVIHLLYNPVNKLLDDFKFK